MKKAIIGAAMGTLALGAVGSYFSPNFTLYQMKQAIDKRDADAFSEHVDFPSLRDSFKGQLMASMNDRMASPEMKSNPFAGIGQAFATALIGPMVDHMVSPAGVIAMMSKGRPDPSLPKFGTQAISDEKASQAPSYSVTYRGWDRAVVRVEKKESDGGSFILKRNGLWSWKLAAIELPAAGRRDAQ